MVHFFSVVFLLLLFLLGSAQNRQVPARKGKLFIIGGGNISGSLRMQILTAANWKKGDIIAAVTLASSYGDSAYIWMNDDFKKLTGENCLQFDSAAVHDPQKIAALEKAKIIFLGGGDQNRFMRLIRNTPVKKPFGKQEIKGH